MIADKIGQPIEVGSIIAYGHAIGRSAGIRIGKVLKLETKTVPRRYSPGETELEYYITVRGISDGSRYNPGSMPKVLERNGTLRHPDRIIVLQESTLWLYRGPLATIEV